MTRTRIQLTAVWGNEDARSSVLVSRRRWTAIQSGAEYTVDAASSYEGKRYKVLWRFANRQVSIDGEDGMECVVRLPVVNDGLKITFLRNLLAPSSRPVVVGVKANPNQACSALNARRVHSKKDEALALNPEDPPQEHGKTVVFKPVTFYGFRNDAESH